MVAFNKLLEAGLVCAGHVGDVHRADVGGDFFKGYALAVAARFKPAVVVEHVGDTAGHAGGEVAPGVAEAYHHAAGHVFAAVIADAFDDRHRPGVAHREALAGHAGGETFAGDGAVQNGVADDDVFPGRR